MSVSGVAAAISVPRASRKDRLKKLTNTSTANVAPPHCQRATPKTNKQ